MSRILVVALVCVLSLASVSFGFETSEYVNYPSPQTGWPVPKPSGLRFPDATVTVQTGAVAGAVEGSAPCAPCGQFGTCIPWQMLPWYGSWEDGHHHQAGCRHCTPARY